MIDAKPDTVLVAEDDPDDRLFISEAFSSFNGSIRLHFVNDGQELLDYLQAGNQPNGPDNNGIPSLIFLDLRMPVVDGWEALKRIKTDGRLKKIPVIVFTNAPDYDQQIMCLRLGADEFITKPRSFDRTVEVLQKIFAKWVPGAQRARCGTDSHP